MNPILLDFPSEFTTERLKLRLPLPGDGNAVNEAICSSINELRPWMPFAQKKPLLEETETNIREAHTNFLKREDLRFLIFHKDGYFVGSTGLHRINWNVPKFEIGYWIKTEYSGKGYVTEAVEGLTNFAFDQLNANRIEIRCDELNINSLKIPEKLGFTLEGTLRNDDVAHGNEIYLRNTCIYGKIRE